MLDTELGRTKAGSPIGCRSMTGSWNPSRRRLERADENSEGRLCLNRNRPARPCVKHMLLVVGLLFGLVETFIVDSAIVLVLAFPVTLARVTWIGPAASAISLVVDPLVVFAVMFLLGRRVDFTRGYFGTFLQFFAGVLAGTMLMFLSVTAYLIITVPGAVDITTYIGNGVFYYGLGSFRLSLVGFAGLAMAHFSRRPSVGPGLVPP